MSPPELNCWYWLPDNEDYVLPGKLIETTSREGIFYLQNEQQRTFSLNEIELMEKVDTQVLDKKISNLIEMHSLTENSVLYVLRNRYYSDNIYTFVSSILVAVNPFKELSIYTNENIENYHFNGNKVSLPPHIYALSEQAYSSLLTTNLSQSIIISGESGAGKTESIKHILKYIAHVSRRSSEHETGTIQDKIVEANPLMEAFGNAKTSRNNNSSRFGKLMTLKFSAGIFHEAKINSYLLEKCRVVIHQSEERNYHIFYQIIAASSNNQFLAEYLHLTDPTIDFRYAKRSDVGIIPNLGDLESFQEVQNSMNVLGISRDDQLSILKVVSGILLLGNLEFLSSSVHIDGEASLVSIDQLNIIADMLGLNQNELTRCLTSRSFGVRSIVTCIYTVQQASDARDAFAKKLYSLLFDWLIDAINQKLLSNNSKKSNVFIAILDIFGFEAFQQNSYEQLLINYCNEKLQFHFNNHIFKMEQSEYAREGVNVKNIVFNDNAETVELLERKIAGILSMIDEEINVPRGTDETLLNKILKTYAGSPLVKRAKPSGKDRNFLSSFVVTHYAGDVVYNIIGFLEKNKDTMSHDLYHVGVTSINPFINKLFQSVDNDPPSETSKRTAGYQNSKKTLGNQFKVQLNSLLDTITKTEPHFVRCLKSNMEKLPNMFDTKTVLNQLRYSGLLEVCKIRQGGFPHRYLFNKFYNTYSILSPESKTYNELVKNLELKELYKLEDYFIGNSKVFFKYDAGIKLETTRNIIVGRKSILIQTLIRKFLAKRRIFHLKNTLINLKRGIYTRDYDLLVESLAVYEHFGYYTAVNRPLLLDAKSLVTRLKLEKDTINLLTDALNSNNITILETTVNNAKFITPPFTHQILNDCIQKIKELKDSIESLMNISSTNENINNITIIENDNENNENNHEDGDNNQDNNRNSNNNNNEENEDENLQQNLPKISRKTLFWPPTHESIFDIPIKIRTSRQTITLTGSLLTLTKIRPVATNEENNNDNDNNNDTNNQQQEEQELSEEKNIKLNHKQMPPLKEQQLQIKIQTQEVEEINEEKEINSNKGENIELEQNQEGKERGRKKTIIRKTIYSEARSLSPPQSPRIPKLNIPQRSFSPPPLLHQSRNSPPPLPKTGIRRSMLTRQVSTADINDMENIHEIMSNLVAACSSEDGITVADIDPIEQILQQVQYTGSALAKYASELMMARDELARARKQLELQTALDALTERTPLWKIRNLVQQAEKIGMENYRVVKRYRQLFEDKGKTDKKIKR